MMTQAISRRYFDVLTPHGEDFVHATRLRLTDDGGLEFHDIAEDGAVTVVRRYEQGEFRYVYMGPHAGAPLRARNDA